MSSLNTRSDRLWRSLEEAAAEPGFLASVAQEFPQLAASLGKPVDRRQVLKLMGAVLIMNGLQACGSKFGGELIPAVKIPPNIIPAMPNFYASAHVLDGYASGIVVKHNMGRPIKVDGNPNHPASLGAADVFAQAQLLDFYDPDRAAGLSRQGIPSDRASLEKALEAQRSALSGSGGTGLRLLTGTVTSPTLAGRIDAVLERYPEARWVSWDPISRSGVRQGAALAYGRPLETRLRLERADVLVAIDGDLFDTDPGRSRHARDFSSRRNPSRTAEMSRVYAIESTPTLLGSVADHRFIAGPAEIIGITAAMADLILGSSAADSGAAQGRAMAGVPPWLGPMVADMKAARGRVFMHIGASQPPRIHALAHAINEALGARGETFELIEPVAHMSGRQQELRELIADMQGHRVESLLILDSNPVYAAPADWGYAEALRQVPFSLALSRRADETGRSATWFVPRAHDWEAWSDARAYDGTAGVLQPQSLPLYDGMSELELLGRYIESAPADSEAAVRATWQARMTGDFEIRWREALAAGVIPGSASPTSHAALRAAPARTSPELPGGGADALSVLFRADPSLWDGRFANNPWLQELPRPLTKLVWDNPLLISPALAHELELHNGDVARLSIGQASVLAPVWILPGQARHCITALLGSGRRFAGSIGDGQGVDYTPLLALPGTPKLTKTSGHVDLASTVHHNLLLETPPEILRHGTLAEYRANPRFAADSDHEPHLYRTVPPGPAVWAMSVDLNACIGCNACVIACQAENNISVVGKSEVLREREMHWLRIDRYFEGSATAPQSFLQPVLCMHCEEAPCENVCPVGATVHDAEGLNVMVYNRCVGTRFCSNNCPYKVRRFNFFAYGREQYRPAESWNPDVTVRARGVMEKCSYCLQRIAEARIAADRDSLPVGEVKTACQVACPTQAFTFGNLADPSSAVSQRKQSPLDYAMLEKQNTRPRTTYEALVRNPNPAIAADLPPPAPGRAPA
ncbi:MAG TPA: TAT-variant-translocated molybdopterin oxidoreductase [Steroidobacteraceae bacterium]|jgi:molybdopterin-containing oxidoreductase family iron-sulfur binding subunit|nr:TAT-variant-translocated molybdopterin oxidoreductase [Steroidobacteraceae bacterium]